jgi:hypothetical protein
MTAGSKPGERRGGRKKGTPNKKTASIKDKLDSLGCDPIAGMAKIAKQAMDEGDMSLALSAFKEIAQYVVPKRKAIELSNEEGKEPLRIEWKS